MVNEKPKEIIVDILQKAAIGNLNTTHNFNPQHIANAIIDKINFEKSYNEIKNESLLNYLNERKNEMHTELDKCEKHEKLLKNYIRGKISVYEEILNKF